MSGTKTFSHSKLSSLYSRLQFIVRCTEIMNPHTQINSAAHVFNIQQNELIAFFSQQTEENFEIATSVINCLNAFVAGDITPPNFVMYDLDQMHLDDEEEMDIKWQMAMATFRAKNFVKRTGKNNWTNYRDRKVGIDKCKIRCFNCHEPWYMERNGTLQGTTPSLQRTETQLLLNLLPETQKELLFQQTLQGLFPVVLPLTQPWWFDSNPFALIFFRFSSSHKEIQPFLLKFCKTKTSSSGYFNNCLGYPTHKLIHKTENFFSTLRQKS
ncbi:hypothetical protein Hanom_Chr16g01461351 [Helianthus anomalus]